MSATLGLEAQQRRHPRIHRRQDRLGWQMQNQRVSRISGPNRVQLCLRPETSSLLRPSPSYQRCSGSVMATQKRHSIASGSRNCVAFDYQCLAALSTAPSQCRTKQRTQEAARQCLVSGDCQQPAQYTCKEDLVQYDAHNLILRGLKYPRPSQCNNRDETKMDLRSTANRRKASKGMVTQTKYYQTTEVNANYVLQSALEQTAELVFPNGLPGQAAFSAMYASAGIHPKINTAIIIALKRRSLRLRRRKLCSHASRSA